MTPARVWPYSGHSKCMASTRRCTGCEQDPVVVHDCTSSVSFMQRGVSPQDRSRAWRSSIIIANPDAVLREIDIRISPLSPGVPRPLHRWGADRDPTKSWMRMRTTRRRDHHRGSSGRSSCPGGSGSRPTSSSCLVGGSSPCAERPPGGRTEMSPRSSSLNFALCFVHSRRSNRHEAHRLKTNHGAVA